MTRKNVQICLMSVLLTVCCVSRASAILDCNDCDCGFSCSTTCIADTGWSTCASTGLCAQSSSCNVGCGNLTAADTELFLHLLRGEPDRVTAQDHRRGEIAARLTWRLAQHVEENGLGTLYTAGTAFELPKARRIQTPALAFIGKGHRSQGGAPDLVVELLPAPGTDRAIAGWLDSGTRAVLAVDPATRSVKVYRSRTEVRVFGEDDFLEIPDLVPGWSVRVGDLFPDILLR